MYHPRFRYRKGLTNYPWIYRRVGQPDTRSGWGYSRLDSKAKTPLSQLGLGARYYLVQDEPLYEVKREGTFVPRKIGVHFLHVLLTSGLILFAIANFSEIISLHSARIRTI